VGKFAESKIDKKIYDSEISVIGFHSKITDGIEIGKNCVIDNYVDLSEYNIKQIKSGEGIIKQ
jgi:hypothetical protein